MRFPARCAMALAGLAALLALGCGSESEETPVACLEGKRAYSEALRAAPGSVRLEGESPISECLIPGQEGGELAIVGEAMVRTATALNAQGRAGPEGPAPLRLGYLLGAAEAGAEETGGIHADLIRRLQAAAAYNSGDRSLPREFVAAYRAGLRAGFERG